MRTNNVDSSLDVSNLVPNSLLVFVSNAATVFPSDFLGKDLYVKAFCRFKTCGTHFSPSKRQVSD